MARPGGEATRARIRQAVRDLMRTRGLDALTLDAVAEEVGVTRQAVLYHFGSREGLLAESVLEVLQAESDALTAAAEAAPRGLQGAGPFLDGALAFYLSDPNRFRLIYTLNQVSPLLASLDEAILRERVYPVTRRSYDALEAMLAGGALPDGVDARKLGIALHMQALGIASYQAMLEACGERFAHDWRDIAANLARTLSPR